MLKAVAASSRIVVRLVPALAFIACGSDEPQVPTILAPVSAAALPGTAGAPLSTIPSVTLKDQNGKGIANVWVKWTPSAGKVVNDSSKTDVNGSATSGTWTLGTVAGTQTLNAAASGLPVATISADAKAGPVSALDLLTPAATGLVGTDVATPPSVRAVDQHGNPVEGASVLFAVTSGAGSITGAQQTTNASGVATVGSWKLGTLSGTQALRADVVSTGANAFMFANALAAPASEILIIDGNAQIGQANKRLCTSPVIAVRDIFGNGVGQVRVTFTPASGSGSVTGGSVLSRTENGYAALGAWNLGSSATQTLLVTSSAIPGKSLTITATVGPDAGFSICARFLGEGGTPRQRQAITTAVARWQRVIVGHVQNSPLIESANRCFPGQPAINEVVEDLLLFVQLAPIDGPRAIIGQAAPCAVHLPSALTLMGFLQLDVADLDLMLSEGTLDNVVTHEIGHILGVGTLWNFRRMLLSGAGTPDPFFLGATARDQFALLLSSYSGTPVPVENTGAAGTRDAHWRRTIFNTELMQGFSAQNMPMSRVTVGSLADMGYTVDLSKADAFSFVSAARSSLGPSGAELVNDVADTDIWGVETGGRRELVTPARNPLKRRF